MTRREWLGMRFLFHAEDGIRGGHVTGVQTCALPIFGGVWSITPEAATATSGSTLRFRFGARRVFLVLGSHGGDPRTVRVLLDGKPLAERFAESEIGRASCRERGEIRGVGGRVERKET